MARHIRERAGHAAQFTARWMLALGAGILCASGALAQSGAFPVKPVRLIVPVAPGGGSDSLARMTAARVGERLGQTFIVENIAGASGLIAVQTVIKAAPDAHTLSINSSSSYNATLLSGKLEGDGRKLLAPVAQLTSQPQIMAVNVSLPIHNLQDLIAYWKKNPDGLNFASSGNGTAAHLVGELVNLNTGVKMVHVPYKGIGPGIADMISGRLQVAFTSPGAIGPHARAGKARLVMVTTPRRSAGLPDVPTAAELGFKGIEWTGWFGILTTAGSPRPSILALNAAFNQALTAPEVQKMLATDGADPAPGTPEQFGETLNNALNVAARVIKELGIKIE